MPLHMRLPKRGFSNRFRKDVEIVNLASLTDFGDGASINASTLAEKGLIRRKATLVKILGEGSAPKKLDVKVNRISASARLKVEEAGGKVELV